MRTTFPLAGAALPALLALASAAAAGSFTDEDSRYHSTAARRFDIEHRDLRVRFDHARRMVLGQITLSGSAIDTTSTITLHAVELEVERARDGAGNALGFEVADGLLHLRLARPLARGEKAEVTVEWRAQPRAGLYFFGPDRDHPDRRREVWSQGEDEMNRRWFPDFDLPVERATSDIRITVGPGETAVSNGALVSVSGEPGGGRTFHYRMDVPHVSYLVSVAAGTFAKRDTAWRGKPVEYYVPPGMEERIRRSVGRTPEMLEFFSGLLGLEYPYPKYAQVVVQDFNWGGMENVSATTMYERLLLDETAFLERNMESLVAHELAHQWFGDYVTCREWAHIWLNEGFATFMENRWEEHAWGRDEYDEQLRSDRASYLDEFRDSYRRPIVSRVYTFPNDLFDSHTYPKGGWVLHMLRRRLGDARFDAGVREHLERHAGQSVDTDQFRRVMEDVSGEGLEQFFEQWFFRAGHPELEVKWEWFEDSRTAYLRVEQVQPSDSLTPVFRFDLPVRFGWSEGGEDRTLRMEGRVGELWVPLPRRPAWVELDPDLTVLHTVVEFDRKVEDLVRQLAWAPLAASRSEAAVALGEKAESDSAVAALGRALAADRFYAVRQAAATALGKVRRGAALEALLAGMRDPDARVRRSVAAALGGFRGEPRAEAAAVAAARDRAYGVVVQALGALVRQRAPQARTHLLAGLERPSYADEIAVAGMNGLAELGEVSAIPALRRLTHPARGVVVRHNACEALGKLGRWLPEDPETGRLSRRDVREMLEPLLWDPQLRVRRSAAAGLGSLGDAEALPALARAEARDADDSMRRACRDAAAKLRRDLPGETEELRRRIEEEQDRRKALEQRVKALEEGMKRR